MTKFWYVLLFKTSKAKFSSFWYILLVSLCIGLWTSMTNNLLKITRISLMTCSYIYTPVQKFKFAPQTCKSVLSTSLWLHVLLKLPKGNELFISLAFWSNNWLDTQFLHRVVTFFQKLHWKTMADFFRIGSTFIHCSIRTIILFSLQNTFKNFAKKS